VQGAYAYPSKFSSTYSTLKRLRYGLASEWFEIRKAGMLCFLNSCFSSEKPGFEGVQVLQQGCGRVPLRQQVFLQARGQGWQVLTLVYFLICSCFWYLLVILYRRMMDQKLLTS
jgi:hypothetical protein